MQLIYYGTDQLRMEMGLRGNYSDNDRQRVYAAIARKAKEALQQQKSVLVDATFQKVENRRVLQDIAKKAGHKPICIQIWAAESLTKKRLSETREDSEADFSVYQMLKTSFDPIEGDYLSIQSRDGNIEDMIQQAMDYISRCHES
ncbi:AAA domain-containing protein [Cyclobacterium lianum]|uniref:AAA domain-containing protein n=2 Tax=Cyclobacterium lianum TaxID=388280 RepID=A0A1M7P804_9BACT|nr:AAA domain-containing protein [Cyclobacterium lianum]